MTDSTSVIPERFVPGEMRGKLVEAEHMARYMWAAPLAARRVVLDAGCGTGYGTRLLSAAGASEVVGIDISETTIELARNEQTPGATFEIGDVERLPYADASFDVVVCFEVIEHVRSPEAALDEIQRVLREDGFLVISSPNRARYVAGNPHHIQEYLPRELAATLEQRFSAVRVLPQHAMLASVIGQDDAKGAERRVESLYSPKVEDELYTVAIAGAQLPPGIQPLVTLTSHFEVREWLEHYREQDEILQRQMTALREQEEDRRLRIEASALLVEREQLLSELPSLRQSLSELEKIVTHDRTALGEMQDALDRGAAELRAQHELLASFTASVSWRLTAPLRAVKRLFRAS